MKPLKQFIYPVYLLVITVVLVIAFNIYDALELFKKWGWYKYFSDLPYLGRNLLIFLCGLMIILLVLENIHIRKLKQKNKELNDQLKNENRK